jgi:hypothetical protein
MPDVAPPSAGPLSHPAPFHGSVMGGHAPIVGAELFVFEAGTGGYASAPSNEMTSGQVGTDSAYGPYTTTGPSGSFAITGDYTCDLGHPVYVAAVGGTASTTATLVNFSGASAATSGATTTVTFASSNAPFVGSVISFGSRAFSDAGYLALNGTTQTVTASSPTSFSIVPTVTVTGTGTTSGFAIVGGVDNPAIVNIAVLGNCPGTGAEFNGPVTFVYIDEVSTIAAAYALQAFGTGFNAIGAPSTNLAGIQYAAINAGQLYNINNNYQSGGVALSVTNYVGNSNGIVPQATIDTLGNILSACVDSTNTASTTSTQCTTLFNTATSNGDTTGTKPKDISSAAFNIAKYPAGAGTQHGTFPTTLFTLQGASFTPFNPALSAAPNDFGIAISYDTTLVNTHVTKAESVAITANDNIWTTAQGDDSITLWSPVGAVLHSTTSSYAYGYVSVDTANLAWTGSVNSLTGIEQFSTTGLLAHTYGAGTWQSAYTVIANGSKQTNADVYFFTGTAGQVGNWYTAGGGGLYFNYLVANNFISHGAIDSSGYVYLTSEAGNQISRFEPTNGVFGVLAAGFFVTSGFPIAGPTVSGAPFQPQPEFPAVDSANNAWVPIQTTYSALGSGTPTAGLYKVSSTGTTTTYFSGTGTSTTSKIYTGANFYQSFGAAVDGLGNVWVTNRANPSLGGSLSDAGNSTLIELTSSGTAISPSTNYSYGGLLSDPLNLAIDPSGNIWVTNFNGNKLTEIIGAAAPVTTPLAAAAAGIGGASLGQRP